MLIMSSCATPRHKTGVTAEQIAWFKETSLLSGLSREAYASMLVEDRRNPGVCLFRARLDLQDRDWSYLMEHPFLYWWQDREIPIDIEKHTFAFDGGTKPFTTDPTSRVWWIYIAPPCDLPQVPCHFYALEIREESPRHRLHYFFLDH